MIITDERSADDWQAIAREVFDKLISTKFGECSGITDCTVNHTTTKAFFKLHYFLKKRGAACRVHEHKLGLGYLGVIVLKDHRPYRSKPIKVETPVC